MQTNEREVKLMKKIIITAVFITSLIGAFFFLFIPGDLTKEDMLQDLEKSKEAFEKVGDYLVHHDEVKAPYIYVEDAGSFKEIESDIKKALGEDFLCIQVSDDHREITFHTSSQNNSDDHRLVYSPFDRPKSLADAETTKFGKWYIKM